MSRHFELWTPASKCDKEDTVGFQLISYLFSISPVMALHKPASLPRNPSDCLACVMMPGKITAEVCLLGGLAYVPRPAQFCLPFT